MNKIKILILLLLVSTTALSQQLKPTEIIYSRMPTNPLAPPAGDNQPTIWVVGQDGSNDRQITAGTKPRISDDGRFLLFNRFTRSPGQYDPFGGYADFVVRELATGQETVIDSLSFNTNVSGLAFSPESNQGRYEIVADISSFMFKFNRDGTNRFQFPWENSTYSQDDFPAVRRGGDQLIAFSNNTPEPTVGGLYTVGISGVSRQKIPNTTCKDFHPAWSNDNQYIAFGSIALNCFNNNFPSISLYPYWIANIFKIKPDGSGRQQITNFPADPDCSNAGADCLTLGYVWTQDNTKVIAAGRISGSKGLFAINADGSGLAQIPISAGNAPEFVGGIVQTRVDQNVVSAGGGVTASKQYTLVSTIGEAVAGQTSSGGTFSVASGFWGGFRNSRKAPFDFDGDGRTDIGIFRPGDGRWWYSRSADGVIRIFPFGIGTDIITPGDWTTDGKTDIAVFRPSGAVWYVLRSEDGSHDIFQFGLSGDVPAPADFTGDGRTDAAVFRPSNGTWYILNSTGGTSIVPFGLAGDVPAAADYDGDGKADIAIYRPSDGTWWCRLSATSTIKVYSLGTAADKPVPGDYTGDGRADIAAYRPSTGEWFIQRSEDNSRYLVAFGLNGDIPSPGDYDGDGRLDQAVFRPSTGTWYVQRSTAGILIAGFGMTGDRPIPNAFVS